MNKMSIVYEGQVVYKNDDGRTPLSDSDFNQELVDVVVGAFNEHGYESLAPFPPGREDIFDKIGGTNHLGVFVEDPQGEVYQRFAMSFLALYGHFEEGIKEGKVALEARPDGSVGAKDPVLDLALRVGD
jgi:hypothetical protein